jgi:hypothetical protein
VSVKSTKQGKKGFRQRKTQAQPEPAVPDQVQPEPADQEASRNFERELEEHFAMEARKKVEEETESIFGSLLARHGWARNERGQVEYVGGEGA